MFAYMTLNKMEHYQKITVVYKIDEKCGLPESNKGQLELFLKALGDQLHATYEVKLE